MRIDVITIFPQYLEPLQLSLIGKAQREGKLQLAIHNLRDYTYDKHSTVDDTPVGGGAGMVMKPEPWADAFNAVIARGKAELAAQGVKNAQPLIIFPNPAGKPFTQAQAQSRSTEPWLIFACGRYEGIDERVYEYLAENELRVELSSLGDYVLNGGEVAVLTMTEAIVRLIPSVLGNPESIVEESHSNGLLEYPIYTKPATWEGPDGKIRTVPEVLLSGNHAKIATWRQEQSLERTRQRRPDLLAD